MTTITETRARTEPRSDEHGNPLVGSSDDVDRYDAAVDRLLRFHPDVVDLTMGLAEERPDFAMGQALAAYLHVMSTDARDLAGARPAADRLRAAAATDRERAHASAVDRWLAGDWHGAARDLDDLLVRWPRDLVALAMGHQLDFFVGDARNLRDRVGRSIRAVGRSHPHRGFVLGMQAFGLEESNQYDRAMDAALEALDRNPDDVWALHAAAHVYEMRGDAQGAIGFMEERVGDWGSGNLFTAHNWWHLGLFHLEVGRLDDVFSIVDTHVHHADSDGVPLELLDASAMLWRLHLDDVDVGERFTAVADAWTAALDGQSPWYVFNDVHAVVALVGAGRIAEANALVDRQSSATGASNPGMIADAGGPVARAVVAFGEQRWDDVVAELWPARRTIHHFGGSHAQRDLVERTLLEGAVRGGHTHLARRLLDERLELRPTGRFALERSRIVSRV